MRALGLAGIVPKTEQEIKVFQKANNLQDDGIIESKTQAALNIYAKPNESQTSTSSIPKTSKIIKIVIIGDSIASSLSRRWIPAEQKQILSGFALGNKIDTFDVEKLVEDNIQSLKGSDLAIISLGSYDEPYKITEKRNSIDNIRKLLEANKYAWIVPYTTRSNYIEGLSPSNPKKTILDIYSKLNIPDSNNKFLTFTSSIDSGDYAGVNPSDQQLEQLLNKIKSIINEV